jgi:uncharacterized protein (DUF885 family)
MAWLVRVDAFLPFLDTCMIKMKEGIERNVVPPKTLIKKMIPQLDDFVETPIEEHIFYAPIVSMPDEFSDADRDRLAKAYSSLIRDKVVPKYKLLQDFLISTYLPAGRETSGIDALPNGPETYSYLLKLSTTTNLSLGRNP